MQARKRAAEAALQKASALRWLLYEQGKPLEEAILIALRAFGFSAQPFNDGESEFDAIFICPEGRCLGEAEGKDSKLINIDKMSQLERNIQEDFARDDVKEFAKGVLFGNAKRLTALDSRSEFFTDKCKSAAKRAKVSLVRTPDLFAPARYLIENPTDIAFATACRAAIFKSEGVVVEFPTTPEPFTPNHTVGELETKPPDV